MADVHAIGLVDKNTMRAFDARCLKTVEEFAPEEIADVRKRAGVIQGVFAH